MPLVSVQVTNWCVFVHVSFYLESDGVVDVYDNIQFLFDVAVQPIHTARSGFHHIHP